MQRSSSAAPHVALLNALYRHDPAAWLETYAFIRDKEGRTGKIRLNYLQRKLLRVWDRCQKLGIPCRIILLKPRQKGGTTIGMGLGKWLLSSRSTSACIIAGEYSQAENAWKMMQGYAKNDAFQWGNDGTINARAGRWSHGSTLAMETARDYNAGRSGTYQFLHATEVGRWAEDGAANATEVLSGILKCVPPLPGTTVIIESTAKGRSGDFYDRWNDALPADRFLAGEMPPPLGYIGVFAPWYEFDDSRVPLTPAQKDEMQRTLDAEEWYRGEADLIRRLAHNNYRSRPQLGETDHGNDIWEQLAYRRATIREECKRDIDRFNQDYPESPEVAFRHSGSLFFNNFGLTRLQDRIGERRRLEGVLEQQPGAPMPTWRATSLAKDARVWVWEVPRAGHRYLIVVDPATGTIEPGSDNPDCHAVLVLRQGYYEPTGSWVKPAVVARIAPPCRWEISTLAEEVWNLARYYGGAAGCLIVPEANMDRGLIELLKLKNAQIAHRKVFNKEQGRITADLGFQTTEVSRGLALDRLARAIREYDVEGEGIELWCEHIIGELGTFVTNHKTGRSEHEHGKHDDDVLALAIGMEHLANATLLPERSMVRPTPPDILAQRARDAMRTRSNAAYG